MKASVLLFRLWLLPQFALFLVELHGEARVFAYTLHFRQPYPLMEGSCLADYFSWSHALTVGVLSLGLAGVTGLAGFRGWGRAGYALFLACLLLLLPFLGPYDRESVVVVGSMVALCGLTAALPFVGSLRAEFPSIVGLRVKRSTNQR